MEFDFEEMTAGRLRKNIEFLLFKIKIKNKKTWSELKEEFLESDEDELKTLHKKVVDTYNSLN